jgi:protein-tyrosine-phosphatase
MLSHHPNGALTHLRGVPVGPWHCSILSREGVRIIPGPIQLDHYAQGRIRVESAGSEPGSELNPSVVAILEQRGLDPSQEFPKPLTEKTARTADVIVTLGCGDTCPVYPGKRYLDWELEDPAGKSVDEVRPIVDEIDRRVQALLADTAPTDK